MTRKPKGATWESWVDRQIREAEERGAFKDLPGAGKPLKNLDTHDPDWWVKGLIQREHISGLGPAAILLRTEDAELEANELGRATTGINVSHTGTAGLAGWLAARETIGADERVAVIFSGVDRSVA